MNSRPLVSVILPFFDEEDFLEEAVESVFRQTFSSWELVLIDDGSTDRSTAIARSLASAHPGRVVYLEHPGHENRSQAASRNAGVAHARGEFVAPLDADDIWLPNKLQEQMEIMSDQPSVAMVCGASEYWESWSGSGTDIIKRPSDTVGVGVMSPPMLAQQLYPLGQGTAPPPSDLLIRRSAVDSVGGFEPEFDHHRSLYEDQAFLSKIYLSHTVWVDSRCWDLYRIRPDSISARINRAGHYRSVRAYYLDWLEGYLSTLPGAPRSIRWAVHRARAVNRFPPLARVLHGVRKASNALHPKRGVRRR